MLIVLSAQLFIVTVSPNQLLSSHLQGLTQVEEMLISAVMPIMSVYRLPQGYSGHVVNLPQDVT